MKEKVIDLIFADPPYFLSNNGLPINSGRTVSVNKGDWEKKKTIMILTNLHFGGYTSLEES